MAGLWSDGICLGELEAHVISHVIARTSASLKHRSPQATFVTYRYVLRDGNKFSSYSIECASLTAVYCTRNVPCDSEVEDQKAPLEKTFVGLKQHRH
jgi:hypothetical protein